MQASLYILIKDRKGSLSIYGVMVTTKIDPNSQLKWQNDFPDNIIIYFNWELLHCLPVKETKDR